MVFGNPFLLITSLINLEHIVLSDHQFYHLYKGITIIPASKFWKENKLGNQYKVFNTSHHKHSIWIINISPLHDRVGYEYATTLFLL